LFARPKVLNSRKGKTFCKSPTHFPLCILIRITKLY
jgi:hypothetical protein